VETEQNGGQLEIKGRITDKRYGRLEFTFYPEDGEYDLQKFFADALAVKTKNGLVTSVNEAFPSWLHAKEILKKKVSRNLHDAMIGLVMEVKLQTLNDLNQRVFSLPTNRLNTTKLKAEVCEYYSRSAAERIGKLSGRKLQPLGLFIDKTYKAYRKGKIKEREELRRQLNQKLQEWRSKVPSYVSVDVSVNTHMTQATLASEMERETSGLARQTKNHGLTHERLIAILANKWKEELRESD
jgi:predicted house-cleaning noncanonical NTP pyrophosphatase (MazG superfamily)